MHMCTPGRRCERVGASSEVDVQENLTVKRSDTTATSTSVFFSRFKKKKLRIAVVPRPHCVPCSLFTAGHRVCGAARGDSIRGCSSAWGRRGQRWGGTQGSSYWRDCVGVGGAGRRRADQRSEALTASGAAGVLHLYRVRVCTAVFLHHDSFAQRGITHHHATPARTLRY
jgi:hypothetical protein